ncbi:LysR family transcriptional regulator [Pendulispora rubella]|uniref:LysR family transcriptional regulator n=1 Tax=Pendulispora rubella TaxID=2741070 RepID=A0ABZ2KSA5_9BACT
MSASLDDLVSMAVFACVVDTKTFTAAAQKLGLSKSVVSARVSGLEARMGVRLLHRTTRRLSLTSEGSRLYAQCAGMISHADEAMHVAGASEPVGSIRVTAPVGFGTFQLGDMIPKFTRLYPGVRVELSLSDRNVDILSEGFDVAIRFARNLRDSSLVSVRIATDRLVVCAAPAYAMSRGIASTPWELAEHDCLLSLTLKEGGTWPFLEPSNVPIREPVRLVTDNVLALHRVLLAGMGLAMMPYSVVADDIANGHLVTMLDNYPTEDIGVYVIYAHRQQVPARVRVFLQCMKEWVGTLAWAQRA